MNNQFIVAQSEKEVMSIYFIKNFLTKQILQSTCGGINNLRKMANKASSKKDIRQSEKRRIANKARRTFVRNCIKNVEAVIAQGVKDAAFTALKVFEKQGMKAVSKGVFHKKTISRKISRLYHRIKKIA